MKHIELRIPTMQSAHCQTRVNETLKAIKGLELTKIEAGTISFSIENEEIKEKAIEAIEKAGYKVDEPAASSTGCCGN